MKPLEKEILEAIEIIKKSVNEKNDLKKEDLEILFIASLLEEENK